MTEIQRREAIEHQQMLEALRALFTLKAGQDFMKYLFKNFEVGGLPELGLEGEMLHDKLGFLRAGQSIFLIACEANPEMASTLLAKVTKENHALVYAQPEI